LKDERARKKGKAAECGEGDKLAAIHVLNIAYKKVEVKWRKTVA
jgi:hypothetical protein